MKGDRAIIKKKKKGSVNKRSSVEKKPFQLYAICLNRPLIELWAMSDQLSAYHSEADLQYSVSVYSKSQAVSHSDDSIPVLLSADDMTMLYNEGLSDYY